MITVTEEAYIALTDLAKLRCAASTLSSVTGNRPSIVGPMQSIVAEIERLEYLIQISGLDEAIEKAQKDGKFRHD